MKHKLKITILSILFGLLFGIPVYAADNTYIIDQSDVLGEYISTLNEKAEKISEEAGLRITCMITNTTEGMGTPAVSEQVYKGLFADDPGFMLIYSIDDQEWFIYSSGMESAPLTEEQENELWNEFAIQDYYVDCVDAYLDAAAAICSVILREWQNRLLQTARAMTRRQVPILRKLQKLPVRTLRKPAARFRKKDSFRCLWMMQVC